MHIRRARQLAEELSQYKTGNDALEMDEYMNLLIYMLNSIANRAERALEQSSAGEATEVQEVQQG